MVTATNHRSKNISAEMNIGDSDGDEKSDSVDGDKKSSWRWKEGEARPEKTFEVGMGGVI
jgi:hypothetical protein